MSNPKLFTPLRIRNLELDNRIVVHAPNQYLRCQPHTLKNLFKS